MDRIEMLRAALVGLRMQAERIEQSINEIEAELRGGKRSQTTARRTNGVSAEGRARIAAAQKKRWASYRAAKAVA
jgi:hypothetical protein